METSDEIFDGFFVRTCVKTSVKAYVKITTETPVKTQGTIVQILSGEPCGDPDIVMETREGIPSDTSM